MTHYLRITLLVVVFSLASTALAHAERFPTKIYTTADGLANNLVNRIVRDSHGYLWFCTREGLSRFDGYEFTTYGTEDGLPGADIKDLLETKEGLYWIATNKGLVRFDPLGTRSPAKDDRPMFTTFVPEAEPQTHDVWTLLEDRTGTVWVGTAVGLYKLNNAVTVPITFTRIKIGSQINSLAEDRSGVLWIGTDIGLFLRFADGRLEQFTVRDGIPANNVNRLLVDRRGRIWLGTRSNGLAVLSAGRTPTVIAGFSTGSGIPAYWIEGLLEARDGTVWAATAGGLVEIVMVEPDRYRLRAFGKALGATVPEVFDVVEDRRGNLWVGTVEGVAKISTTKIMMFGESDGIGATATLFDTRNDGVIAMQFSAERYFRCSDQRTIVTKLPPSVSPSWGWNQMALVDREGDWWIGTRSGVLRYHGVRRLEQLPHARPVARYAKRDGLGADVVIRLFEDSRGDVWIATVGEGPRNGLSRWERKSRKLQHYGEQAGLPSLDRWWVSSFGEDQNGNLWIGFSAEGGLVRYRNGRFERFGSEDGIPSGLIRNLITDTRGRLWVATYHSGLLRIERPSDEHPQVFRYTTAQGLSSNVVTAIVEDGAGRIYAATGRGLDRLDPTTGKVRTYWQGESVPVGEINAAIRDPAGTLWASYPAGLMRILPGDDPPPPSSPDVLISGMRVAGEPQHISVLGQSDVPYFELPWNRNSLEVDFVSPGLGTDDGLRYQIRLEGGDNSTWSMPSEQRTVVYANLAPGRYRFRARAMNPDGVASDAAAGFSFRILPPFWQRWWFRTVVALLISGLAYGFYRSRVSRLLEVVAMRTRIATDLHDDIGANLTRIAVLSEVVRRKGAAEADDHLASIASVARESVTAMSDIVWAISPDRDGLNDLASRMRSHAEEVFGANGTELTFRAASAARELRLSVDTRRDAYLIFKEALNNAVRHSGCSSVHVSLESDDRGLILSVTDDGAGFDVESEDRGNGLASMRSRAVRLGAKFDISSGLGKGTTVRLEVPHHRVH